MAAKKPRRKKPVAHPDLIRTHSLTPEAVEILQKLTQEASDRLGWRVSGSAVVRAFLRHAKGQGMAWAAETLFPLIEREIQGGIVWGSKKR